MQFSSWRSRACVLACFVLAMLMAAGPVRATGPWEGTWTTTYGELRLRQDGARVWGDYINQSGVIEARTSPDGLSLYGTFLRADEGWGLIEFTLSGAGWQGAWRWNDVPQPGDAAWNATARTNAAPPVLIHAVGPGPFWPPTFAGQPAGRYATWIFGPDQRDPHQGGTIGPPAVDPVGGWYGGYDTDLFPSGYNVSLSIDDLDGPGQAIIDLAFFAPSGSPQAARNSCPREMHPQFCAELHARFSPDIANPSLLAINLLGARIETQRIAVVFALAGDATPRLMLLTREGIGGGDLRERLTIYHPVRGLDLDTVTLSLPHPCDAGTCGPWRSAAERSGAGPLADPGLVASYLALPDLRAAAHGQGTGPTPPAPPQQTSGPASLAALTSGTLAITDGYGQMLGALELRPRGDGTLIGGGWLVPAGATGAAVDIGVWTNTLTAEAVDLTLERPTIPASPAGRLLVTLSQMSPGAPLTGTLVRGDSWDLVTLARIEPEPHHDEELFDLPGVGVYGPPYRLRNTNGGGVVLRSAPRSDAPTQGSLEAWATDIVVTGCTPEIDSLSWELANLTLRRQMLDAVWCEASRGPQAGGWVPGYFLDPIPQ
ncbi:hypothetical protein [Roseicyclus mahoneyensis]|uniref:Uncharacterized protein n=1 Tax=Roseicyclus mahoneyensis TaxID=164332 RepID=A0A316GS83_9RHOB|nr:hypothetical protein [Roseicyclus mahoneyensis]PWK62932.1 hypothetical protein C7455_101973 [Roseicyclus mahoneyensis]